MTLTTEDLDYLEEVERRGICLDLSPLAPEDKRLKTAFQYYPPDKTPEEREEMKEKRLVKLGSSLERLSKVVDGDGRLRASYREGRNGYLRAHPNYYILPHGFITAAHSERKTTLLEIGCPLDAIAWARLLGARNLADELLQGEVTTSDILRQHFPDADKKEIVYLKLALFKSHYGAPPKDVEESQARDRIREEWPRLFDATPEWKKTVLAPKVGRMTTKLSLAMGRAADTIPGARTVGLVHGDILVEYRGENPQEAKGQILTLVYDLLRFWDPTADPNPAPNSETVP